MPSKIRLSCVWIVFAVSTNVFGEDRTQGFAFLSEQKANDKLDSLISGGCYSLVYMEKIKLEDARGE